MIIYNIFIFFYIIFAFNNAFYINYKYYMLFYIMFINFLYFFDVFFYLFNNIIKKIFLAHRKGNTLSFEAIDSYTQYEKYAHKAIF